MAGYLAFLGLFSLFPFLFFFVAVASFFGGSEAGTHFVAFVFEQLPDTVGAAFATPIAELFQTQHGGLLTLGVAGAIWTASTGIEGLRVAIARAHEQRPTRAAWYRRLQSFVMVLIFAGVPTVVLLYAPFVLSRLQEDLNVTYTAIEPWLDVGLVFVVGTTLVIVWVLYYVLPARRPRWYRILPGTACVVLLGFGAARLFSRFVEHFDSYQLIYGSLAGVVLSLLLFYIFGAIFVFGAELNAAIGAHLDREDAPSTTSSGNK